MKSCSAAVGLRDVCSSKTNLETSKEMNGTEDINISWVKGPRGMVFPGKPWLRGLSKPNDVSAENGISCFLPVCMEYGTTFQAFEL